MSDINYEAHPEYASYGNWEDLAAAQKKEIERLRGHINWLNDANDGGRLAINEIERLRDLRDTMLKGEIAIRQRDADEINRLRGELDAAALEVARLERLVWTPMNAYPEIERLRKELAEKDDYIRTVSRPIGAHSYE